MQLTPLSHQEGGVRPQLKDLLLQVAADGGRAEVLGAVGSVEAEGAVTVDHRDSTGHAGPGGVGAGGCGWRLRRSGMHGDQAGEWHPHEAQTVG